MEHKKTAMQRFWGKFARGVIRHRLKVILAELLLILATVALFLPNLTQDVAFESIFGKDSDVKQHNQLFKDLYGRDEVTIVALPSDAIFSLPFLTRLQSLHEALENASDKIEEVTSLLNARITEGTDDSIIVHDLMENFPQSEAELQAIKDRVLRNKAYRNTLINKSGTFTTIIIKTEVIDDLENVDVVLKIREIVDQYRSEDFPIYVAGSPAIMQVLDSTLAKDFGKFIALTLLVICVILGFLFRRPAGILLPVLTIFLTLLLTLAFKSMFHSPISTVTNALIPFILAVGVADSVHILSVFFSTWTDREPHDALIATVEHCGTPCLLTSVTTAAGLFAFMNRDIITIRDLGIFGGIGALTAFVLTMTLLIAGLSFLKKPKAQVHKSIKPIFPWLEDAIPALGVFGVRHYRAIFGVIIFTAFLIGYCISLITVAHDPLSWLGKDEAVVTATRVLDEHLAGSVGLELMINSDREGLFKEPDFLQALEQLEHKAKAYLKDGKPFISSVTSLLTIIREVNQAVNEGKEEFYTIPRDRKLIAQELLLFETGGGADSLQDYVSFDYSDGRMTFRAPWIETTGYAEFLTMIEREAHTLLTASSEMPQDDIVLTGNMAIFSQALKAMLPLSIRGFGLAFLVISVLLIILFRNVKLGLISMIPNLFPIGLTLALMGVFDIHLDMFNLFVGSIALGIVVDDTIHVIHHFQQIIAQNGGQIESAVKATLTVTGRALLFTSVILCLGFSTYLFSSMGNIYSFGILLIVMLTTALFADFIITPAVLMFFYKNRR